MRIARLPQDNPRTQGAIRREWYRRHSKQHLRSVEALTRAAAARSLSDSGGAVVLGAGACTELPLAWLAAHADGVTLVDVDIRGMVSGRDELPAALRPRVNLVQADLTGGVSEALQRELTAQPWAELVRLGGASAGVLLDSAALCLERCPISDPPRIPELAPLGYDLVISDLALTQLFSLPLLDVVDTLMLYSAEAADLRDTHTRYAAAAATFRRRVALAHLSLIELLTRPGGCALLITDTRGHLLPPASGPHALDGETMEVLPTATLDVAAEMSARFERVEASPTWTWTVSEPGPATPGRAYDVMGVIGSAATLPAS